MDNYWQALWDKEVPKGSLKHASISLALNSPWNIKATKDHLGRIGFQLIAEKIDPLDEIFTRELIATSQVTILFIDPTTLYMRLEDIEYLENFNDFAESIINKASIARSEKEMLDVSILQSFKWFNFLKPKNERKLKPFQQKGLIAELLFLKKLIDYVGNQNAVNSWFGSSGSDKDFILGHLGFEVKAKQSGKVFTTISSAYQLDLQGLENLYLVVYIINSASSKDEASFTLTEIINKIREIISRNIDLKYLFETKIAEAGFDDDHDYSNQYWSDREKNQYYNVTETFPSITSKNINVKSIAKVIYDINLETIKQFKVDDDSFDKCLS